MMLFGPFIKPTFITIVRRLSVHNSTPKIKKSQPFSIIQGVKTRGQSPDIRKSEDNEINQVLFVNLMSDPRCPDKRIIDEKQINSKQQRRAEREMRRMKRK
jgi:hypothetical protein